jgi:hypothetical protein
MKCTTNTGGRFCSANQPVDELKHNDDTNDQAGAGYDSGLFELARGEALPCPKRCKPYKAFGGQQQPDGTAEKPDQGNETDEAFKGHFGDSLSSFRKWESTGLGNWEGWAQTILNFMFKMAGWYPDASPKTVSDARDLARSHSVGDTFHPCCKNA